MKEETEHNIHKKEGDTVKEMSEAAREAQREYRRQWRAKNKDKAKEYQRRYWERKAQQKQEGGVADGGEREEAAADLQSGK